jgi:hypothetical protein
VIFRHDYSDYKRDFKIIDNYIEQMAIGLSKKRGISYDKSLEIVKDIVSKRDINAVKVRFTYTRSNGDRVIEVQPLLGLIRFIEANELGMSPTMTTYYNPKVKPSLITEVIAHDMLNRSRIKKEAMKAKMGGDLVTSSIKTGMQNAIKRRVNSWSGAALSRNNTFNNPSLHPTLSSMCRMSTALTTASIERLLAGKRYYHTYNKVIEDILYTISKMDRKKVVEVIELFNLNYLSNNDVFNIIKRSSMYYWWDKYDDLYDLVSKLDLVECTFIGYVNDLYHLFKYNDSLIRSFITRLIDTNPPKTDSSYIDQCDDELFILISNLISDKLGGRNIRDCIFNDQNKDKVIIDTTNSMVCNILNILNEYKPLIDTFFKSDVYPIGAESQDNAIRLTVPLGDTDSTIFSTKHINELYFGKAGFNKEQEPVNDLITYITNGLVGHVLANYTAQLGVIPENRHLIRMKNELKIPGLVITPVAKTYHAYVKAEEGNVFKEPSFVLKGERFHGGRLNASVVSKLHDYMEEVMVSLNKGGCIDRDELIEMVYNVECDIKNSLDSREKTYLKKVVVKTKSNYTNPNRSVWANYLLWNLVFSGKYGKVPEETYPGLTLNVVFNTGYKNYIESLSKPMQDGFMEYLRMTGKSIISPPKSIIIPYAKWREHGIPDELKGIIDLNRIIRNTLDPHYLLLESMGLSCFNSRLVSDNYLS